MCESSSQGTWCGLGLRDSLVQTQLISWEGSVSWSWRAWPGCLFWFCQSCWGQCTCRGRRLIRRHCSCWPRDSPWTYIHHCSDPEGRETEGQHTGYFLLQLLIHIPLGPYCCCMLYIYYIGYRSTQIHCRLMSDLAGSLRGLWATPAKGQPHSPRSDRVTSLTLDCC